MIYYTYILKSLSKGTHYYGSTSDLENRLKNHNAGKVKSTKGRRPWVIHYFEEYSEKGIALKREAFFKTIDGYIFLKESNII